MIFDHVRRENEDITEYKVGLFKTTHYNYTMKATHLPPSYTHFDQTNFVLTSISKTIAKFRYLHRL